MIEDVFDALRFSFDFYAREFSNIAEIFQNASYSIKDDPIGKNADLIRKKRLSPPVVNEDPALFRKLNFKTLSRRRYRKRG